MPAVSASMVVSSFVVVVTRCQRSTAHLPTIACAEANCRCRRQVRLWELILADNAEAEFIEFPVSQLMQLIHHVVMTTLKSPINPGRLQYREFEGSFQELPTLPVRVR